MGNYSVRQVNEHLWVIDENGHINLYLLVGEHHAALIDSGFDGIGLPEQVRSVTNLPLILINSHAHGDHTSGDWNWDTVYIHKGDSELLHKKCPDLKIKEEFLEEGQVIDLGGIKLEVIHIPGHSKGSVALLNKRDREIYVGDTLMVQPVFMHFPECDKKEYLESLKKLKARRDDFDSVFPSHRKFPLDHQILDDLYECAEAAVSESDDLVDFDFDLGPAFIKGKGYRRGIGAVITEVSSWINKE